MFNLVTDPWIPVWGDDGAAELSLSQLAAARERRWQITDADLDSDKLTGAAATRLVLACHLAAAQAGLEWGDWLEAHARDFELFDPDRPFGQCAAIAPSFESVAVPAAMLPLFHANTGAILLEHTHNDTGWAMTPAQAARLMLVRQAFGTVQRQPFKGDVFGPAATFGKNTACLVRPFAWVRTGRSFAEDLAANTPARIDGTFRFTWPTECVPGAPAELGTGVLDLLTWPGRALLLEAPQADGLVHRVAYCAGVPVPENLEPASQPHALWRLDKTKGVTMLRPAVAPGWSLRVAESLAHGANLLPKSGTLTWSGLVADKGRVDAVVDIAVELGASPDELEAWLDITSTVFKQTLGQATSAARRLGPDSANVDKAAALVKARLNTAVDTLTLEVLAGLPAEAAGLRLRQVARAACTELSHAWSSRRKLSAALALEDL